MLRERLVVRFFAAFGNAAWCCRVGILSGIGNGVSKATYILVVQKSQSSSSLTCPHATILVKFEKANKDHILSPSSSSNSKKIPSKRFESHHLIIKIPLE